MHAFLFSIRIMCVEVDTPNAPKLFQGTLPSVRDNKSPSLY